MRREGKKTQTCFTPPEFFMKVKQTLFEKVVRAEAAEIYSTVLVQPRRYLGISVYLSVASEP